MKDNDHDSDRINQDRQDATCLSIIDQLVNDREKKDRQRFMIIKDLKIVEELKIVRDLKIVKIDGRKNIGYPGLIPNNTFSSCSWISSDSKS